ncbi:hypothetical protein TSUD_155340 [Trifolium subterraneum]|uniref:Uncharacterized protein n=1 Tax=Trifolium subterraneum TaxID=3900 RepID=A0A2Z6N071_TRISU|nr:hypothetical protein TSUD_155340 [Trifolium subterraneum]
MCITRILRGPDDKTQVPGCFHSSFGESASSGSNFSSSVFTALLMSRKKIPCFLKTLLAVALCLRFFYIVHRTIFEDNMENIEMLRDDDMENMCS